MYWSIGAISKYIICLGEKPRQNRDKGITEFQTSKHTPLRNSIYARSKRDSAAAAIVRERLFTVRVAIPPRQAVSSGSNEEVHTRTLTACSFHSQLRMLKTLVFNLLDDRCRAVCADLGEATHVGNIEAHGNDGVSSAALRLGNESTHCIVASGVELGT